MEISQQKIRSQRNIITELTNQNRVNAYDIRKLKKLLISRQCFVISNGISPNRSLAAPLVKFGQDIKFPWQLFCKSNTLKTDLSGWQVELVNRQTYLDCVRLSDHETLAAGDLDGSYVCPKCQRRRKCRTNDIVPYENEKITESIVFDGNSSESNSDRSQVGPFFAIINLLSRGLNNMEFLSRIHPKLVIGKYF